MVRLRPVLDLDCDFCGWRPSKSVASYLLIAMLTLTSLTLGCYLFILLLSSSSVRLLPTGPIPCPVRTRLGQRGQCTCGYLAEIRCTYLESIPMFIGAARSVYAGLDLSAQNITKVPDEAFVGLLVRRIVINFNPIGDGLNARSFRGLERILGELYAAGCGLRRLPLGLLRGMTQLNRLHLWANQIEAIPPRFFESCSGLRELSMWGNSLEELEDDSLLGLRRLWLLDLENNRIRKLVPSFFRHLPDLRCLRLSRNKIHAISEQNFALLPNLRVLDLDLNGIGYIYRDAFEGLGQLRSLSLRGNLINILPDNVFSQLNRLETLDLRQNDLEFAWEMTFSGLKSLTRMYLSENRLTELSEGLFRKSQNLAHLDLDGNLIERIHPCVLSRRTFLVTVSLISNPLRCGCRLAATFRLRPGSVVWGTCARRQAVTWKSPEVRNATDGDEEETEEEEEGEGECEEGAEECKI